VLHQLEIMQTYALYATKIHATKFIPPLKQLTVAHLHVLKRKKKKKKESTAVCLEWMIPHFITRI